MPSAGGEVNGRTTDATSWHEVLVGLPMTGAEAQLRAGAARVDLTPSQPTPMAGYPVIHLFDDGPRDHVGYVGRTGNASGTHDPLYARALALGNAEQTLVLVAVDLCMVAAEFTQQVRQNVAREASIGERDILIGASHTHSGPDLFGQWEPPVPGAREEAVERVSLAVRLALQRMRPASLGWARGRLPEPIVNRRDPTRPIDPEIGVLRVNDAHGELLGAVMNYACHPIVVGSQNREYSADYPGYASAIVEHAYDGSAVCLFLNGPAGNINPSVFPYAPDRNISVLARQCNMAGQPVTFRSHAEARRFGNALGGEVLRALELTETDPDVRLVSCHRTVHVPLKSGVELDRFVEQWGVQPWVRQKYNSHSECELELHGVRIGDAVVVGVPGEPFVELGLRLKGALPNDRVFMVGYANDYPGYIPTTADAHENRYETVATPLAPVAGDLVQEAVIDLAREVARTPRSSRAVSGGT